MNQDYVLEGLYREYDRMLRRKDPQSSELKKLIWNHENKNKKEKEK